MNCFIYHGIEMALSTGNDGDDDLLFLQRNMRLTVRDAIGEDRVQDVKYKRRPHVVCVMLHETYSVHMIEICLKTPAVRPIRLRLSFLYEGGEDMIDWLIPKDSVKIKHNFRLGH